MAEKYRLLQDIKHPCYSEYCYKKGQIMEKEIIIQQILKGYSINPDNHPKWFEKVDDTPLHLKWSLDQLNYESKNSAQGMQYIMQWKTMYRDTSAVGLMESINSLHRLHLDTIKKVILYNGEEVKWEEEWCREDIAAVPNRGFFDGEVKLCKGLVGYLGRPLCVDENVANLRGYLRFFKDMMMKFSIMPMPDENCITIKYESLLKPLTLYIQ